MPKKILLQNAILLPGIFKDRENINHDYLLELKQKNLLQNFYIEAGVVLQNAGIISDPSQVDMHFGWESSSCQLRGHFLGHWMSAAAIYGTTYNDKELLARLEKVVDELEYCQIKNGGKWIGSIPEKYMHRLEQTDYIWSPQYTMHKTVMGLYHTYLYTKNSKALKILDGLSDWYTEWVEYEKEHCPDAIKRGEQGGMLEMWASLFECTQDKKYLELAQAYSDEWIFKELLENKDCLTNTHCNASIPFIHGACKMYSVTKDDKWLTIAKNFWYQAVENRGSFCTGGTNSGEFWIAPNMFNHFLNDRDQEFCTMYNMVRLADYLFCFTGESKYLDYIELCLYNGFLAQQNKYSGMPTYFLSLSSGSVKKWGSRTKDFWCCHGTMVQAQTLYSDLCYYNSKENNCVYIAQYIPSVYEDENIKISQEVDMKFYDTQSFFEQTECVKTSRWQYKFSVNCKNKNKEKIIFRVPNWNIEEPKVLLNSKSVEVHTVNGFIELEKNWNNDIINISFVPKLSVHKLNNDTQNTSEDDNLIAFMEGPIVLAGLISTDCGIVCKDKNPETCLKPLYEHVYNSFSWKQSTYVTTGQETNFNFIPLYEITDEKYTVYFSQRK